MRKVLLVPTLLLAGLAVAALAVVAATSRTATRDVEKRIHEVRRASALAFRMAHLTVREEQEVLAYRLERDPASLAKITAADREMIAVAREIGDVELPPRGRELWEEVLAARALRGRVRVALLDAVDGGDPEAILRAYARWELASRRANALAGDLSVFNIRRLERAVSDLERVRSRSVGMLVGVLGVSAALVLAFSYFVDRYLVRHVRAMTEAARRIASERVALPVPGGDRSDELGVLARAMTRTADDLVRANEELARSVAARDEFLSIASHELKTPLTALKLQLQIGQRRFGDRPGGPPWLQSALRQLERVEALVAELLDLARIRSGRLTLRLRPVDLGDLARGVAERLREVLAKSGNELAVEVEEGIVCDCDPGRIEQVLANLLVNASQHAPGVPVSLTAVRDASRVVLSVEDAGAGIPAEVRERVFEPYEKVDRGGRGQGLGLGLYIARQIVEAHGGRIRVAPGRLGGACFVVDLSVAEPEVEPAGGAAGVGRGVGAGRA